MKNYPKLCISPTLEPQRGFIGTREEGGQGTNPGPKRGRGCGRTAAEMRLWPRFRGYRLAARAALRTARCPFGPLSDLLPVSGF